MGIYDRDYYRREGPGFLGSFGEQGRVTRWLLGITIACYLLQFLTRTQITDLEEFLTVGKRWHEPFTEALILNVDLVLRGQVWRLLTYGFLHSGDIWHIVFNMLFLYWFGRQVEEAVGSREYLALYLGAIVVSGLGYLLATQVGFHRGPGGRPALVLGASGGVMAVLVLAALYNPRQTLLLFFVIPVPIWAFVGLYVLWDAFALFGRADRGVATSAHLAGAAFGFAYYKLGFRLTQWLPALSGRRSSPRLRLYREDEDEPTPEPVPVARRPAPPRPSEDVQLDAQVDAILAKIQHVGMAGLTDNERETLVKASEAIKRRRG